MEESRWRRSRTHCLLEHVYARAGVAKLAYQGHCLPDQGDAAMEKQVVVIPGIAKSGLAFSHVVRAGGVLYLTSQLSCDLKTGLIEPGDAAGQTRNALANVRYLLENAGSSLSKVVKAVVYMRHASDLPEIDKAYREFFPDGEYPARVAVEAASPIADVDVEIEIIALV